MASVSREAVPLPMAMCLTLCLRMMPDRIAMASCFFFSLKVGYTTAVSSTFPVGSTTATLQPLRYPGSRPMVTKPFTGGCISRGFKFRAKL